LGAISISLKFLRILSKFMMVGLIYLVVLVWEWK